MLVTRFEVGNISCKAFTDLFTTNYNVDARDKVGVITNYIVNDRFTRRRSFKKGDDQGIIHFVV